MESTHGKPEIAILIVFLCLLLGCSRVVKQEPVFRNFSVLQNGDLIYRKGNGYFSNQFRDFSQTDKVYSHVGIVQKMADSIFVIHAEASELTGIGKVKKEDVSTFLEGIKTWAVYRLKTDTTGRNTITKAALQFYRKKTPFDADFDLADTSAVYCTELAALCVNKALDRVVIAANTCRSGRKFIAIDDTYRNTSMELIFQTSTNNTLNQ